MVVFTGTKYSEIEQARVEVAAIISRNSGRLTRWKAEAGKIVTEMTTAGTDYGPIVAAAAALLAADPTNEAVIVQNAAVGKHLEDFNALVTEATTLDTLVNSQ